ncbi:MAG: arginine--tRNA ligase [Hyphomonadaceae bacterium]|jgi:arginyl-tRNA synthetase|nr:arginine--tRNA ligase [Hyphomonadaceae bacterium]
MDLAAHLSARIGSIFAGLDLPAELGRVARAQKPEFGHYQCNGAMAGAKASSTNPRELATRIAARLAGDPDLARVEVAGPGFLNLTLSDEALAQQAARLADDPRAGAGQSASPLTVVVDYGGPNVAKPMHVGHLRSAIIGESLKRMFRFAGHTVHGDAHFGDWGFQMGLLIVAVGEEQPDLIHLDPDFTGPYPSESPITLGDLERLYPLASGRVKAKDQALIDAARKATAELQGGRAGYVALWRHFQAVSRVALERDYGVLGVQFDLWNGESDADPFIAPMVADLEARGLLADDAGARVIFVHDRIVPKKDGSEGPDIPPLLVVSSEGSAMYGTTDLATIVQRKQTLAPDLSLYVVDQRQADHFEQVFRAADKAGYMPRGSLEHIGFGTMNGKDGKPFKTRDGGVLKLSDLIAMVQEQAQAKLAETGMADSLPPEERDLVASQVGMAALKFADLQNFRGTSYQFDLDRFLSFEGKTGPYLLYAAVRIASILRKAADQEIEPGDIAVAEQAERDLILTLDGFDSALAGAIDKRAPHLMAEHVYAVASAFSAFYTQCPILASNGPVRASRLALAGLTLKQLHLGFDLLGLQAPQRM